MRLLHAVRCACLFTGILPVVASGYQGDDCPCMVVSCSAPSGTRLADGPCVLFRMTISIYARHAHAMEAGMLERCPRPSWRHDGNTDQHAAVGIRESRVSVTISCLGAWNARLFQDGFILSSRNTLFALALGAFVAALCVPISGLAESMTDVIRSARNPTEQLEACSWAFSDLGSAIRVAHTDADTMPESLVHEDLQGAEDLQVTALIFDHVSRQLEPPSARKDAIERITQAMVAVGTHDDNRHTRTIEDDQDAVRLCKPIYDNLRERGVVTTSEEETFRKLVRDSNNKS